MSLNEFLGIPTSKENMIRRNVSNIETIGGWVLHDEGQMTKTTKINAICETCGDKYIATAKKNTSQSIAHIFNDWKRVGGLYDYGSGVKRCNFSKVKVWFGFCPNCKHKQELFCETIQEVISDEWH